MHAVHARRSCRAATGRTRRGSRPAGGRRTPRRAALCSPTISQVMVASLCCPGSLTRNAPGRGSLVGQTSAVGSSAGFDDGAHAATALSTSTATRPPGGDGWAHGLGVDLEQPGGGGLPAEGGGVLAGAAPTARRAGRGAVTKPAQRRGPSRRGSWPSTSTPETPSRTAVRSPPTAAATTGVPHACDSTATRPNDSLYEGTTVTSAARYQSASSGCGAGGTNRDDVGDAELGGEVGEASRAWPGRCRWGRRRRRRRSRSRSAGSSLEHPGGGAQQHVGGLQRLDPADEQQHVTRPAAGRAGAGPRRCGAGPEDGRGRRRGSRPRPAARSAPYSSTSSRGLVGGVGDQPVGGLHDLLLADHAGRAARACRRRRAAAFLTLAMVCMECTSGTPQRSLASQPTWPDSQ